MTHRPFPPAGRRAARAAAALALVFAAVCGGLTLGAAPAAAAAQPMSACTTTRGVVLAVDFSHWGGPLLRSCGTTPTTGYALLNQGGWQTTGTQHDGPAFICRIGYAGYQGGTQYPTVKGEPCVLTPPATAYWSYWHADPGQKSWSYSKLGATSYHPEPGSVDLWIFGATNTAGTQGRPTFSPDTVRAHNTAPGTSSGAARPPVKNTPAGNPATAKPTPARTSAAPTTPPTAPPATPTGTPVPTGAATTAGSTQGSAPRTQDAEPTAAAGHSTGSVLPAAITAAVVAVIAVLTVLRVRRRRDAE
ncbi:hypothetical protein [Streptomyces sp. IBSBF 2435]|uniref:hypothetical protein n=1 Tax=Streptomyces sp. IBSBF 2435 TaxID=2903531 RepID=UPI002FDC6656